MRLEGQMPAWKPRKIWGGPCWRTVVSAPPPTTVALERQASAISRLSSPLWYVPHWCRTCRRDNWRLCALGGLPGLLLSGRSTPPRTLHWPRLSRLHEWRGVWCPPYMWPSLGKV